MGDVREDRVPIEVEPPAALDDEDLAQLAQLHPEDQARALGRRNLAVRAAELGHSGIQVFSSRRGRWRFRCSCMAEPSSQWWAMQAAAVEAAALHLERAVREAERVARATGVSVPRTVGGQL